MIARTPRSECPVMVAISASVQPATASRVTEREVTELLLDAQDQHDITAPCAVGELAKILAGLVALQD
jgi:hypothetical protein